MPDEQWVFLVFYTDGYERVFHAVFSTSPLAVEYAAKKSGHNFQKGFEVHQCRVNAPDDEQSGIIWHSWNLTTCPHCEAIIHLAPASPDDTLFACAECGGHLTSKWEGNCYAPDYKRVSRKMDAKEEESDEE